jgi:hypothetical protein
VYDSAADEWCTPAAVGEPAALELADELNARPTAGQQIDGARGVPASGGGRLLGAAGRCRRLGA